MDSETDGEEDHPHDTHSVWSCQVIGDDNREKYDSLYKNKSTKLDDLFLSQFIVIIVERGLFEC